MLYRGRLAPSPTGRLHLGHAATFWTASQRAVAAGGVLVLRMEDLDPQRSRPEFAQAAIEDLDWLGIRWQEGPDIGGPCAPYAQSQRRPLYQAALAKLIAAGRVYPCRCTRKDLAHVAQAPHRDEPVYPGTCRPGPRSPVTRGPSNGDPSAERATVEEVRANWRFLVPEGEAIEFEDGFFGPQRFVAGKDFGDFLVWRKDGVAAYQLAVAVDDAAMRITEVVRGADLLKATARQILLCRALGLREPAWRHCPLIADADGRRLAKRNGLAEGRDAFTLSALRESRSMSSEEALAQAWRRLPASRPETPAEVAAKPEGL